jgi:hypothetical protein
MTMHHDSPNDSASLLYSTREVTEFLGVSVDTLARWRALGTGAGVREVLSDEASDRSTPARRCRSVHSRSRPDVDLIRRRRRFASQSAASGCSSCLWQRGKLHRVPRSGRNGSDAICEEGAT